MESTNSTNGYKEVETKKNTSVTLKSTDRNDLFSVIYEEKILGYINTKEVNNVRFVPISEEMNYSITELEKITSSLKKARQMKQQQVNAIENFLN